MSPKRRVASVALGASCALVLTTLTISAKPAQAVRDHGVLVPAVGKAGPTPRPDVHHPVRALASTGAAQHARSKPLPRARLPHGVGSATLAGTSWATVSGLPLKVRQGTGPLGPATGEVTVSVTPSADGVALIVDPASSGTSATSATSTAAAGAADLQLDYSGFATAHGGAWGSRLQVWSLPACFVTTPTAPGCGRATAVRSTNDSSEQTLSFTAPLSGAASTSGSGAVVYAVAAGASGDAGSYQATQTPSSGSWQVGSGSGAFTYSYPISLPPAAVAGTVPEVSLAYDSQSVDGRNLASSGQVSMLGEGWQLAAGGYITRSYASCADDDPANLAGSSDLCWSTRPVDTSAAHDGSSKEDKLVQDLHLVIAGRSSRLVQVGDTNQYRLQDDPSWQVTRVSNANDDTGLEDPSNTDNDNESFRVRTPDGTTYWFGFGHGSSSTQTEPVFGNTDGEPCHADTFADSWCQQAYQWNLDRVIDRHGNETDYDYDRQVNYYALLGDTSHPVRYDAAGYLTRITYGSHGAATPAGGSATSYDEVDFTTKPRCVEQVNNGSSCASRAGDPDSGADYPDVPTDQICSGTGTCNTFSPVYFSTQYYSRISTKRVENGTSLPVDTYQLTGELDGPAPDSVIKDLWLHAVRHTGTATSTAGAGAAVAVPDIVFSGTFLRNRIDNPDGQRPFYKQRVTSILNETGGRLDVTYDDPALTTGAGQLGLDPSRTGTHLCSDADVSAKNESALPGDCYPSHFYAGHYDADQMSWWNKYLVVRVALNDTALGYQLAVPGTTNPSDPSLGRAQVFDYTYSGAPAWRYDRNPQNPDPQQTWDDWRGYQIVTVHTRKVNPDNTLVVASGSGPTATLVDDSQGRATVFRGLYDTLKTKNGGPGGSPTRWGHEADVTTALHPAGEEDDQWRYGRTAETDTLDGAGGVMARSYSHYAAIGTAAEPQTLRPDGSDAPWWAPAKYVYADQTLTQARAGAAIHTVNVTVDTGTETTTDGGPESTDHRSFTLGAILSSIDDHATPGDASDDVATCTTWAPKSTNTTTTGTIATTNPATPRLLLAQSTDQHQTSCTGATLSGTQYSYDNHGYGAAPSIGDQTLASADVDGTRRIDAGTSYDGYGRVTGATQPYDHSAGSPAWSTTAYSPAGNNLTTSVTTTGPSPATGLPTALAAHVASAGFTTTTTLDAARGVATTQTDANGQATSLGYDALGRLTSVTQPGNGSGVPNIAYSYRFFTPATANATAIPSSILTTTLRSTDGGSPVTDVSGAYYDGWNRQVETQRRNQRDSAWLVSATGYDERGLAWLSIPGTPVSGQGGASGISFTTPQVTPSSGDVYHYTTTAYDALGRPTQVNDVSRGTLNRAVTTSYLPGPDTSSAALTGPVSTGATMSDTSALVPTTTPTSGVLADPATASVSKTVTTLDALGRTHSVDQYGNGHSADPAGTGAGNTGGSADDGYASYTYTPLGQLATIAEPLPAQGSGGSASNATWTFDYDRLGRKTSATDPDTGTTTYGYDALGDTTMSDDALPDNAGTGAGTAGTAGGQIQTTYDVLGRPLLRERVTDPGTGSEGRTSMGEWVYDQGGSAANALGRLSATTSHTTMGDFATSAAYDVRGNLVSETRTYPKALLDLGSGSLSLAYRYTYNQLDQVTSTGYPASGGGAGDGTGAGSLPALTTTDVYGPYGTLTGLTDSAGHTLAQFSFDDLDRNYYRSSFTGSLSNDANRLSAGLTYGGAGPDADRVTASTIAVGAASSTLNVVVNQDAYSYDTAGNLLRDSRTTNAPDGSGSSAAAWCYGYDGIQRLRSVVTSTTDPNGTGCSAIDATMSGPFSPQTSVAGAFQDLAYTYSGGRLATVHSVSPGLFGTSVQDETYSYASSGHPHAATQISANGVNGAVSLQNGMPTPGSLTYDAAGRISNWNPARNTAPVRGQTNYTYDPSGNPTFSDDIANNSSGDIAAAYDLDGARVARDQTISSQNVRTTVLYLGGAAGADTELTVRHQGLLTARTVAARRVFTTPDGTPLATQDGASVTPTGGTGSWTWQAGDARDSVVLSKPTDSSALTRQTYYPFGDLTSGSATPVNERSYLDKPYDPTRDIRLDARTYSPTLNVLTTPDPVLTPMDPQHLSPYSYSGNNPIGTSDPSGLRGVTIGGHEFNPLDTASVHAAVQADQDDVAAQSYATNGPSSADLQKATAVHNSYASGRRSDESMVLYGQPTSAGRVISSYFSHHSETWDNTLDVALEQVVFDPHACRSASLGCAFEILSSIPGLEELKTVKWGRDVAKVAGDLHDADKAAKSSTSLLDDASRIESHLTRLDHSPANDAMLARIRGAAADGRPLTEAEQNFMTHELTEAGLMDRGMGYPEAHELAGQTHPTFGNYDPEVIKQFPELFNQNWRNYWGIE